MTNLKRILQEVMKDTNGEYVTYTHYSETFQLEASAGCIVASGSIFREVSRDTWDQIEQQVKEQILYKGDGELISLELHSLQRWFMVVYQYHF